MCNLWSDMTLWVTSVQEANRKEEAEIMAETENKKRGLC